MIFNEENKNKKEKNNIINLVRLIINKIK